MEILVLGIIALLVGYGLLGTADESGGGGSAPPPLDIPVDNVNSPTITITANIISADQNTWPQGDVLWAVCRAIAYAEGAYIVGSVPDRLNNPGDISDGKNSFPQEYHSGSNVTHFPDKGTGWMWLYTKVQNIADGISTVYSSNMTWTQIGQKWAGDWQSWVNNVCFYLKVNPNSTFKEYTG